MQGRPSCLCSNRSQLVIVNALIKAIAEAFASSTFPARLATLGTGIIFKDLNVDFQTALDKGLAPAASPHRSVTSSSATKPDLSDSEIKRIINMLGSTLPLQATGANIHAVLYASRPKPLATR